MFGSDIVEVAIGMVFLFLFMSMIASALREVIESIMQNRAKYLERGLREMLRSGTAESWVKNFYEHPLIYSLYKGDYVAGSRKLPAYIPKESFSLAILDLAAKASEGNQLLSFAALQDALRGSSVPVSIKRVMLTAVSTADGDLAKVRKSMEDWYDSTMDRVTGWYTRNTTAILFVIGICAAVTMNVDAITVAKHLINDKPLRDAAVAQADSYVKGAATSGSQNGTAPEASPAAPAKAPAAPGSAGADLDARWKTFTDLRTQFDEIGYPIGWTIKDSWLYPAPQACTVAAGAPAAAVPAGPKIDAADTPRPTTRYICNAENYWWMLASSAMGWLTTAIAIMLGAPFWFNLLNKLISLRTALKPSGDPPKPDGSGAPRAGV